MANKSKCVSHQYHKYYKVEVNGIKVWACSWSDCNHHMPKHYESMVVGKGSYCMQCNEKIILDTENMKNDMPICYNCKHGKLDTTSNPELAKILGI
jgi:formylmethanofuran dehydrogenase subunit E